jgi:Flp pilus assembly protein TadG
MRRGLAADERGAVAVLLAMLTPLLIGVAGLALDLGGLFVLDSELQDLADAAALAGAAELDGTDTAITRATSKATTLLQNNPRFASDSLASGTLQVLTPVFYETLGGSVATDPKLARYIKVTTQQRSKNYMFVPVLGSDTSSQAQASAVAGRTAVACNVPPLFMCNPNDPNPFVGVRGQMWLLQGQGGTGTSYGPGAFGLLDPPNQTSAGAGLVADLLASNAPHFCYVNGVSVRTGEMTGPMEEGFNTRFDIYANGSLSYDYPPAPNVIKGKQYVPPTGGSSNCDWSTPTGIMGLPQDKCFRGIGSCTAAGASQHGNGDWTDQASAYWAANHPGKTKPINYGTTVYTRYDLYKWELSDAPTGTEIETPQCYAKKGGTQPIPADATRRLLYVAMINCSGYNIHGNSTPNMQAASFAKFFLTEPASDGKIYAEFVELITPSNTTGVLHNIVQLYR